MHPNRMQKNTNIKLGNFIGIFRTVQPASSSSAERLVLHLELNHDSLVTKKTFLLLKIDFTTAQIHLELHVCVEVHAEDPFPKKRKK